MVRSIKPRHRNQVFLKVLFLSIAPFCLVGLAMLFKLVDPRPNPFSDSEEYLIEYVLSSVYPESSQTEVLVEIDEDGYMRIEFDEEPMFEVQVEEDGKYTLPGEVLGRYTLFWVPVPSSIPILNTYGMRELSETPLVDVTGLFGPPGETYGLDVKNFAPVWNIDDSSRALRRIRFLGSSGTIVGEGFYDSASGLLHHADSYARHKTRLYQEKSDFRGDGARNLTLVLALLGAVCLAFYDIVRASVDQLQSGKSVPVRLDFSILGYTAILVDVFYDHSFFHNTGESVMTLIHLGVVALVWFRFGWWALIPALEVVVAYYNRFMFGSLQPAYAYFPGLMSAWLLALLVQGTVSPPSLEWIRERVRARLDQAS